MALARDAKVKVAEPGGESCEADRLQGSEKNRPIGRKTAPRKKKEA